MYQLPRMPYQYGALEPYIKSQIMEIHHSKHHQAYVDGLNIALSKFPHLFNLKLQDLLINLSDVPQEIRTAVQNHAGGVENHTFFWDSMINPINNKIINGKFLVEINKEFESFLEFQDKFNNAAKSCFGSGWVWVCFSRISGRLSIISTANQNSPFSIGLEPILGLDVWEHAYYLQYLNRRVDYISSWWSVVNWQKIEERYCNLIL